MATYQTYTAIGQREDLSNVIYDISPTDTPIMSSIGKSKATAVYHEWQTDSLAAATTNTAAVEGDDATVASLFCLAMTLLQAMMFQISKSLAQPLPFSRHQV